MLVLGDSDAMCCKAFPSRYLKQLNSGSHPYPLALLAALLT